MNDIYDLINEKAFSSYSDKIEKDEMGKWVIHWFTVAKNLENDYKLSGKYMMEKKVKIAYQKHLKTFSNETQKFICENVHLNGV